jgi:hypothetical protein
MHRLCSVRFVPLAPAFEPLSAKTGLLRKSSLIPLGAFAGHSGGRVERHFVKAIDYVAFVPEYELVDSQ